MKKPLTRDTLRSIRGAGGGGGWWGHCNGWACASTTAKSKERAGLGPGGPFNPPGRGITDRPFEEPNRGGGRPGKY